MVCMVRSSYWYWLEDFMDLFYRAVSITFLLSAYRGNSSISKCYIELAQPGLFNWAMVSSKPPIGTSSPFSKKCIKPYTADESSQQLCGHGGRKSLCPGSMSCYYPYISCILSTRHRGRRRELILLWVSRCFTFAPTPNLQQEQMHLKLEWKWYLASRLKKYAAYALWGSIST